MPSATPSPEASWPSHVYETRPFCSCWLRTSVATGSPCESRMSTVTVSGLRSRNEMTATSSEHSQTGEKILSTCVPVTGLFSSLSRSVTANAVAVATSSASTISVWGSRDNENLRALERADENERLRVLAAAARAVESCSRADRRLAPRVRVRSLLRLVVRESRQLALEGLGDVDEPVRHEPARRRRRPLRARRRRVRQHTS